MESSHHPPTPREAAAALAGAQASRAELARSVSTPSWFEASLAVAIAVHLVATAAGVAEGRTGLLAIGLVAFAAVAAVQLVRFRRLNGLRLDGFASRVVLGSGAVASTAYAIALASAIWAATADRWWLVALCAAAGGVAYVLGGRRWLRRYQEDHAL